MKKVGIVINPIAGMGGRVGLKGTDGKDVLAKARELGSIPESPKKAMKALEKLLPIKDDIMLYVASGDMGENEAKEVGLNYEVIYQVDSGDTSVSDTVKLCEKIKEIGVDLILFAGGDGTARDIFNAVENKIPSIGIPAGVKIHSPVYGNTPESAGQLAFDYLSGAELNLKDEEVMDLDEEAFRRDEIDIKIYGYLSVPYDERHLQNLKSSSPQSDHESQESIAEYIVDNMKDDVYYIIGSGTTTMKIMQALNLDYTILGVDVVKTKELVAKDVNEKEILEIIRGNEAKIIVTLMGGQGYIFGRGNQQLSANVLREVDKDDVTIIATQNKLSSIGNRDLLIYTMDDEIDEKFSGYYKVVIGYGRYLMHRASTGV